MFCCGNEDVFSPSEKETTSENVFNDSRNMPELFYENAHNLEKNADFMAQKKYNLVENINSRNKVNGTKEQILLNMPKSCEQSKHMVFAKNCVPFKNFEEIQLGVSLDKNLPMEICIPDYKISFPNKRNQNCSFSERDYQELNSPKINNSVYKCKQTKPCFSENIQNNVPQRFEKSRNKEQMIDKLVIANNQFPANNLLKCTEKKEIEVIDLETMEMCDNSLDDTKTYSSLHTTDEVQTLLTGSEQNCITDERQKKVANECNYKEKNECFSSIQQHQIQANIIEQLIKDTVGFEFDAIRQLLYLQHMLLLRHLQQNLEVFESHNSLNSEFLLKIIEELMQENKLLKKAFIANQRKLNVT